MADDQPLIDLLPGAVLRIDIGGAVSGTGIVVAPHLVLTCAHVLKPAGRRNELITLHDTGRPDRPAIKISTSPDTHEEFDVALLQVPARSESPIAMLGESVQVDDDLAAYGYTTDKPGGTPATFQVEGIEAGPPRLIKFKAGVAQSGMSGAPVLNRRTGMVCGVLRRTRDRNAPTGGLAIPIELALRAFPQLRVENHTAMQRDKRWHRSMSADQQAFLQRFAGIRAASLSVGEIVVSIGQEADRWTVLTEVLPPEGDDWGAKKVVDLNVLRQDVARLLRLLRARNRLKPAEQSRLLGLVLSRTLWDEHSQARILQLLSGHSSLNVSLRIEDGVDEDLKYLPWEQLAVLRDHELVRLASSEYSTLTRVRDADLRATPPSVDPLVIMVVNAPGPTAPVEREVKRYVDALSAVVTTSASRLVRIPSPTYSRASALILARAIEADAPDIVHYVGFGEYEGGRDALQLDGRPEERFELLEGTQLAECVAGSRIPRLVVLQPYRIHDTEVPVDFTTLAPALLEVGVEAVLAFPLPVDSDESGLFFRTFYEQVFAGSAIRAAVQAGRAALDRKSRPWAFPALIAGHAGDAVLTVPQASASGRGMKS